MTSIEYIVSELLQTKEEKYGVIEIFNSYDNIPDVNIYFYNDLRSLFQKHYNEINESYDYEIINDQKMLIVKRGNLNSGFDLNQYNLDYCILKIINITNEEAEELLSMSW